MKTKLFLLTWLLIGNLMLPGAMAEDGDDEPASTERFNCLADEDNCKKCELDKTVDGTIYVLFCDEFIGDFEYNCQEGESIIRLFINGNNQLSHFCNFDTKK